MKRPSRMRRRHVVAFGIVVGGMVGGALALAFTVFGPNDTSIWWPPAGLVTGIFAGMVLGLLFSEELKGEEEDEAEIDAFESEAGARSSIDTQQRSTADR
jgi:peptidoglycan/LPS O-acetylase OafA/YrhL